MSSDLDPGIFFRWSDPDLGQLRLDPQPRSSPPFTLNKCTYTLKNGEKRHKKGFDRAQLPK